MAGKLRVHRATARHGVIGSEYGAAALEAPWELINIKPEQPALPDALSRSEEAQILPGGVHPC